MTHAVDYEDQERVTLSHEEVEAWWLQWKWPSLTSKNICRKSGRFCSPLSKPWGSCPQRMN